MAAVGAELARGAAMVQNEWAESLRRLAHEAEPGSAQEAQRAGQAWSLVFPFTRELRVAAAREDLEQALAAVDACEQIVVVASLLAVVAFTATTCAATPRVVRRASNRVAAARRAADSLTRGCGESV